MPTWQAPLRAAGPLLLDGVLAGTAVLLWAVLDRSRQGLLMALAAALGGPLIEVVLINQLHLYSYTHPDVLGAPAAQPQPTLGQCLGNHSLAQCMPLLHDRCY